MSSSFSIHCCNGLNPLIEYHVFRQFSTLILLQFVSNVRWHFFVFRNSGEKLCVSWALPFVECVAVWALKLPVPHTDVLKTHESQNFFYGIMGSQRNQSRKLEINKTSQTQFILWMCFVPFQSFYKALLQNYGKPKTPHNHLTLKQETIIGNSMLLVLPIIFSPDTGGICDEGNQTTVFDW